MKHWLGFCVLLCLCLPTAKAQELFLHNQPASVLPSGAFALKSMTNWYPQDGESRVWQGMKLGYGVTSKFELGLTAGFSNHNHPALVSDLFINSDPDDLDHDHSAHGHSGHGHFADSEEEAAEDKDEYSHPYAFNGFQLYAQYRFFNRDGPKRHFRMAGYGIASSNFTTHNFSEPNLLHRTGGFGAGVITTGLYNRMALSLKLGGILPLGYREADTDRYFRAGNALDYSLSFGYLLYPAKYKSYNQLNINLYTEFMGNWHGAAKITEAGAPRASWFFPATDENAYLEARPGIQFIFRSKVRLGLSGAFPLISRSYAMEYPQVQLNIFWLILR